MTSPRMPEAKELAGRWVVTETGSTATCALQLTAKRLGTGHLAIIDRDCFANMGLAQVGIWRPAPDGIALARSSGAIVAFFSKRTGCYVHRRAGGSELTLRRS